jgi:formylglycine-generating enzyme
MARLSAMTLPQMGLIALSLGACEFDDPEPDEKPTRGATSAGALSASAGGPAVNMARSVAGASSVAKAGVTSACLEQMLEVQGNYCTDLMHRCVKGGKSHTGEEADEPEPFYCDQYQQGFAKCLGKEEPKHFCIDEFEYPNQTGAIPMVMVSWFEARRLCEVAGKRLCGDDEWTLACEGPARLPYPYGWVRDRSACNIDHLWIHPNDGLLANKTASPAEIQAEIDRLSKREPSGSRPRCRSPYGVMDMAGNVDEWAVNVTLNGKPYQSVFKGGHWVSGARNRCRPLTASHDETTAYYAEGFRCCANVSAADHS